MQARGRMRSKALSVAIGVSPLPLDLCSVGSQRDDVGVSCERRLVGHSTSRLKIQCTPRRVLESRPQVVGTLFESIPPGLDMSERSLKLMPNSQVSTKTIEGPRIGLNMMLPGALSATFRLNF